MSSEESSSKLLKADLIPPEGEIEFQDYKDESQLPHVMKLVLQDLSEPYSSKLLFLGENNNCMHLDSPSHILPLWYPTLCFLSFLLYGFQKKSLYISILSASIPRTVYPCGA